jgi:hypothetical protein
MAAICASLPIGVDYVLAAEHCTVDVTGLLTWGHQVTADGEWLGAGDQAGDLWMLVAGW